MTNTPSNDSDRDDADGEKALWGEFGELATRIRSRLRPGGPDVDLKLLTQFGCNTVSDSIRDEVRQKIQTWLQWHEAYWRMKAMQDLRNIEE